MEATAAQTSNDEEMNIYLKIVKTLVLKVKKSEEVASLKALVRETEGISENDQQLLFAGTKLNDGTRLVDHGVKENSTLHLFVQNLIVFDIYIKLPSNERFIVLKARPGDSVQMIKELIQRKEGIDSATFTLVYNGMLLEEDKTLASVSVRRNSIVNLVFCPKDAMSISIKTPNEETLKLKVKALFTVLDVKAILGGIIDFQGDDQKLFYEGQNLEDCRTLAFYDIKDESVLELVPSVPDMVSYQIFVRNFEGKSVPFEVSQSETVKDLNVKILQKLKLPIHRQFIVFEGKRLEDERTLESYRITKNSTLFVRPRP